MRTFLSRHQAGERQEVWSELAALGPRVRQAPILPDAMSVAHETMRRVASNIDALLGRLWAIEYWFRSEGDALGELPSAMTLLEVEEAEEKVGPVPLSLRALLLEVGGVDFCGQHPDWPHMYADAPGRQTDYSQRYIHADPLVVTPARHLFFNIREWEGDPEWPLEFEFAPDVIHKMNFSGGESVKIALPDQCADPVLAGVENRPGIGLVEYFRKCFSWGGFPGLEFEGEVPATLAELRSGLLPI